jgi:hypothetical protein
MAFFQKFAQTLTLYSEAGTLAPGDFTGNPKKATVTLAQAMPSTDYSVAVNGQGDLRFWTIESKTTTSFVVNANANQALTDSVDWQAQNHGAL